MSDENIRSLLWGGGIPIAFQLTPNEVTSLTPPQTFYTIVPRMSYFPLVSAAVRAHFITAAPAIVDEMWFDYKGKPLKWHFPIGVLFDLLASPHELPWNLTVHFQGFPTDQLLRSGGSDETVKRHLMNLTKESTYVKFGDCSKVYNLSVTDSNDLWEGIKTQNYDKFWSSNSKLMGEASAYKHVPVRVFLKETLKYIQEPVLPFDENKNSRTLGSVLQELLPQAFFDPDKPPKAVIQGTTPSLATPIVWLLQHYAHPDNFLYIVCSTERQ